MTPQSSPQSDSDFIEQDEEMPCSEEVSRSDRASFETNVLESAGRSRLIPLDGDVEGPGWACRKETPNDDKSTYVFDPDRGRSISGFPNLDACVAHAEGRA